MSSAPPIRLKVKRRKWLDPRTQQHTQVIVIGHGPVFVRIPIAQVYEVSNQIVDLAEQYERKSGKWHSGPPINDAQLTGAEAVSNHAEEGGEPNECHAG